MKPVRIRPEAAREFLEIVSYYNEARAALGDEFAMEFHAAVDRIVIFPEAWSPISKRARRYLLKRFPYAIAYRNRADDIVIYAVISLNRHPDTWRHRLR